MRVDIPAGPMAGGAPNGMGRTPDLSAEVTVKRETFWRLLWGMVRRPGATLARLNEDGGRAWLWVAALALVLAMTPVWANSVAEARQGGGTSMDAFPSDSAYSGASGTASYYGDLSAEGDYGNGEMPDTTSSGGGMSTVLGMLGSAAGVAIRWLLWAVALYIVATVSGGRSSFGQTLHMVAWTWLPYAVRGLIQTVYLLLGGAPITYAGLAGFAPGAHSDGNASIASAIWQHLLGQVDVFWAWNLVLLVLGIMTVAHLARRKSILVTAGVWLLITALGLVPVLIKASLASSGM